MTQGTKAPGWSPALHAHVVGTSNPAAHPSGMETSRRILLKTGLVTGGAALAAAPVLLDQRPSAAAPPTRTDPFTLGVASGDPLPDGFVLWTRLAPDPLADDGRGRHAVAVTAGRLAGRDRRPLHRRRPAGSARTGPELGHTVHVEVGGLLPGREYFYRFRAGRHLSPSGRTGTAPDPLVDAGVAVDGLRLVLAVRARLLHRLPAGSPRSSPT